MENIKPIETQENKDKETTRRKELTIDPKTGFAFTKKEAEEERKENFESDKWREQK